MMKKSLIALAVGAAVTAPVAQAVTFEVGDDTEFTVYGNIESAYTQRTDATGEERDALEDIDSQFGFKGEHQLDANTTGFFRAEFEFDPVDGSQAEIDETFFGIEGNFGTALVGTHDTLYEDEIAELLDEYELGGPTEEDDGGEGDQITYFSPDMNGLSFAAEVRINGDADSGIDESGRGLAAVIGYASDMWGVRLGFDDRGAAVSGTEFEEETTTGFGGWFDLGNGLELAGRVATQNNVDGDAEGDSTEYVGGRASFDYGAGSVNLVLQDISPDEGDSRTETIFGVRHDVYDQLEVLFELGQYDLPEDEEDYVGVGAIYSF